MEPSLWQQQTLKLHMSTELSQAISLLQFSTADLFEFLQEKALQNPLIQINDFHGAFSKRKHYSSSSEQLPVKERKGTLEDYLIAQMRDMKITGEEARILQHLIYSLNSNGYLQETTDELASLLAIDVEKVEEMVRVLQQFEPIGVGAHSLAQCLWIQLDYVGEGTEEDYIILTEYFDQFAFKKWKAIEKETSINLFAIQELQKKVLKLNPRPGAAYERVSDAYVTPDFIVKQKASGKLIVLRNNDYNYDIQMDKMYKRGAASSTNKEVQAYLKEHYKEFSWLSKGIETRRETLGKIMESLLVLQKSFFLDGPTNMKPLTLRELADFIDVHESTVSRAVKNKYVQTPFGTYPMQYFFTTSIAKGLEETSSTSVKTAIKHIVQNEDKSKPLSDKKIVSQLKEQYDVSISRRTVAKYREQLNILASSLRKTY
ncbi:RNA polymerase factor sigma-54 [Priestia endophytica]|uniref:RNA polymerase factor sigma-54 n=1 Tax=Priestia endophytica TaxID=135735 RepID=UPI0022803AD2|nr:RNA polymerase factor sigma-54 [Priestia endophytica]MCY8231476.1 RNA polymerase factor sigma-54 [Priestia endophytica]